MISGEGGGDDDETDGDDGDGDGDADGDYDDDDDEGDEYDDADDDGDVRFYIGCFRLCQERSRKTGPLTIGAPRGEAGVGPRIPSSTKRTAPAEVLGELLPRTLKSTRRTWKIGFVRPVKEI